MKLLFNLRNSRIKEFMKLNPGNHIGEIFYKLRKTAFQPRLSKRVIRRRYKTCLKCPIYNKELNACKTTLLDGRELGCGCYVPYLIQIDQDCWGASMSLGWRAEADS